MMVNILCYSLHFADIHIPLSLLITLTPFPYTFHILQVASCEHSVDDSWARYLVSCTFYVPTPNEI